MSYRDFTLPEAQSKFGLEMEDVWDLFSATTPVPVGADLERALAKRGPLALAVNTEKARSEWLIAPVVGELWERCRGHVSVFSGHTFDVDASQGLTGVADYIVCRSPQQYFISAPVLIIVEAKKDDIIAGLGQCVALMVAAQLFNQQHKHPVPAVYGCVSAGDRWKFLRLTDNRLAIDLKEYLISQPGTILSILLKIIGPLPKESAAA
jgi:hypothetical protein